MTLDQAESKRRLPVLLVTLVFSACGSPSPIPSTIIDLSPIITEDLPARIMGAAMSATRPYPVVNPFQHFTRDAPPYVVRNSLFTLLAHGGPHVDAGIHIFPDGGTVNDFTLDQFVGPLRLLDVRDLPKDQAISRQIVEAMEIREDDIVVLFGGYEPPRTETQFPEYHHLSAEAAEYLASIPVRAFATDGWSVDARGGLGPVVHEAFLPRGIPVIEQLVNLDAVPDDGEVVFVGLPLNVADANGAPMRAAAFVYE